MIILCFLCFKEFRTLPGTVLLLASPAKLMANIAQLISANDLRNPNGAECQFQALILEWLALKQHSIGVPANNRRIASTKPGGADGGEK